MCTSSSPHPSPQSVTATLTSLTFLLFLPVIRTLVQHIMITSETTTAISPTVALILSWAPKNHSPQCRLSYFTKTHLPSPNFPVESCHMAPRTYSELLSRQPRPPSFTFLHTLPWIPDSMEFILRLPLWRNCLFITHRLWYPHYSQNSDWQALAHIHVYMWKWKGWSRVYAMQNVWHMNEERVISPSENKGSVASIRRGECRSGKHSICPSFISYQGHPIGNQ